MVSTREGSASSCRPEKASTRELRSSIVIGASSSEAMALATANRSPDGSPPSDSGSTIPTSPSASTERSISARWPHGAPRLRPSRATPAVSAAVRTSSVSGTGARSTSAAAPSRPSASQQGDDLVGAFDPDPEHQRVPGQHRLVHGIVDDHPADVTGAVGVPVREVEQGRAEVVEHPPETGAWPGGADLLHGPTVGQPTRGALVAEHQSAADLRPALQGQTVSHSVEVVTSASRSGSGDDARARVRWAPARWPSSSTNGSVMSAA